MILGKRRLSCCQNVRACTIGVAHDSSSGLLGTASTCSPSPPPPRPPHWSVYLVSRIRLDTDRFLLLNWPVRFLDIR
jgi:hypothetical protein